MRSAHLTSPTEAIIEQSRQPVATWRRFQGVFDSRRISDDIIMIRDEMIKYWRGMFLVSMFLLWRWRVLQFMWAHGNPVHDRIIKSSSSWGYMDWAGFTQSVLTCLKMSYGLAGLYRCVLWWIVHITHALSCLFTCAGGMAAFSTLAMLQS